MRLSLINLDRKENPIVIKLISDITGNVAENLELDYIWNACQYVIAQSAYFLLETRTCKSFVIVNGCKPGNFLERKEKLYIYIFNARSLKEGTMFRRDWSDVDREPRGSFVALESCLESR